MTAVPPPLCTWCFKPATHLTLAPLPEIWHDPRATDPRQAWAESCRDHRRGIAKPRALMPWRPKFPQTAR
jgi:hypothetical protein